MKRQLSIKLKRLKKLISKYESVLIAFSGGVDSTFLLRVAVDVLGMKKVTALTVYGELFSSREIKAAKQFVKKIGVKHILIKTSILQKKSFLRNKHNRCYICKKSLFRHCLNTARSLKIKTVCDGSQKDDLYAYRPGNKAARELKIRQPLAECKLDKEDIRIISRTLNLPNWNNPSSSCLATRFPYARKISLQALDSVEKGEEALKKLGLVIVRLRYYGDVACIEAGSDEIHKFLHKPFRGKSIKALKRIGFKHIMLDLEGYRSGKMDEATDKI